MQLDILELDLAEEQRISKELLAKNKKLSDTKKVSSSHHTSGWDAWSVMWEGAWCT